MIERWFAQRENERECRLLRNKLGVALCVDVLMKDQHVSLVRDHKTLLGIL